jgi:hypothetical protein
MRQNLKTLDSHFSSEAIGSNLINKISNKIYSSKNEILIIRDQRLKAEHLDSLLHNKALAIIISNFASSELCSLFSQRVLSCNNIQNYTHEIHKGGQLRQEYYGVDRVGVPFNSTYNRDNL